MGRQDVAALERNKALIRTYWDAVNAEDYATLARGSGPLV